MRRLRTMLGIAERTMRPRCRFPGLVLRDACLRKLLRMKDKPVMSKPPARMG